MEGNGLVSTPRWRRSVWLMLGWAMLAWLGLTRPASAQSDSAETESLIRQGVALRMKKEDERALPFFQKAYERSRTPRTAGQLGLAEMAIGYWTDAERHLTEALESTDHPWIAKNHVTLEKTLAQARGNVAEISLDGSPSGASVSVNGREVGRLPLPAALRVNKGPIEIQLRAPGYVETKRSMRVAGREQLRVTMTLEKVASPTTPQTDSQSTSTDTTPVQVAPDGNTRARDEPESDGQRKWAWGLALGAGAALAFGVVETVSWQRSRVDFNNHLGPPPDNPSVTDRTMWVKDCNRDKGDRGGSICKGLYEDSRRAELLSFVGYGAGAVLAVGSVILFLHEDRPEAHRTACAPVLGPGLACRVVF